MVDAPGAGILHGYLHGEHAALPGRMERRLVLLGLDPAEPVHAAHVVDTRAAKKAGIVDPIIEVDIARKRLRIIPLNKNEDRAAIHNEWDVMLDDKEGQ